MAALQKATQQQTKTYNSRLVLRTIYDRGQVSRADVARVTNLTRTTVSDIVAELQDKGLVEEIGLGQSIGGRSPILLSVVDNARHLIGIDLGNDELRGAVVNLRNEVIDSASLPIESRGGEEALASVYDLVDRLVQSTSQPLLGICIGTPGLVDTGKGVVLRAVNLDWRNLPLGKLLEERYGIPVYVANDSQLAALARYMFDGEKYHSNVVVVRVGHGIGAGIVLNGALFQGDGFGAGEIGHIAVVQNGAKCRCGNAGCLETVASIPSVLRRAEALAQADPSSLLRTLTPPGSSITIDALHKAFEGGDKAARQVIDEVGQYLGIAAAGLVGTLNIRHLAIMSDLARFGETLANTIREVMLSRSLPPLAQDTEIELIDSNRDIVILGASALLLTDELGLRLVRQ